MRLQEAFVLLEVNEQISIDDLKSKYKKLAVKYHPDVNKEPGAVDKFKKITEAYNLVKDFKENPWKYNVKTIHPGHPGHPGHKAPTMDDLFGSIFGSRRHVNVNFNKTPNNNVNIPNRPQQPPNKPPNNQQDKPQPNPNVNKTASPNANKAQANNKVDKNAKASINITLEEAFSGCQKSILFKRKEKCKICNGKGFSIKKNNCTKCDGFGKVTYQKENGNFTELCDTCDYKKNEMGNCETCKSFGHLDENLELKVNIPAGVYHSPILKLKGFGNYLGDLEGSDVYSNVDLQIRILPHVKFKISGVDIITTINVNLLDALKGSKIEVDTLYGKQNIELPKNTKDKDVVFLKHKGLKRKGSKDNQIVGSQRCVINIVYPKDTTKLIEFLEKDVSN